MLIIDNDISLSYIIWLSYDSQSTLGGLYMNNQQEYLKTVLDDATERLRKAMLAKRPSSEPPRIIEPKGQTLYRVRRAS